MVRVIAIRISAGFFAHKVDSCTDQCPGFVEKIRALNELAAELKRAQITKT